MKLFAIDYPGAKPVEQTGDGAPSEFRLGEAGRGRTETLVPVMGEGAGFRAKKVDDRVILVRGEFPREERCLAIVRTTGAYSRGVRYGLREAKGVTSLATGYEAFGDAGRLGGGETVLAIVEKGAEFRLPGKYQSTWYYWDGGSWKTESPDERSARAALEKFISGEGEWL